MKGILLLTTIVICEFLSSCNMGKDKNNDAIPAGTDTSMMNNSTITPAPPITKIDSVILSKTDSITSKNNTVVNNASADSVNTKSFAKPNLAKKRKKGSIKIEMSKVATGGAVKDLSADKDGYFSNVEILPAFPGGQRALENFFDKNIQYPAEASDNGVEGIVKIVFSVDELGKVSSPNVVSQNIGYGIEKEAMRVFSKMPTWTPGKIKGKNVKTKYTLPVNFRLD